MKQVEIPQTIEELVGRRGKITNTAEYQKIRSEARTLLDQYQRQNL